MGGAFTLVPTRVVDAMALGTDEEDEGETVDRSYWEQKASRESVRLVDQLATRVKVIEPDLEPKYNKHYIGLANNGVARNFVAFRPRKQHVIAEFNIPRSDELSDQLDESGLEMLPYVRSYRMRVTEADLSQRLEQLDELIRLARDAYRN